MELLRLYRKAKTRRQFPKRPRSGPGMVSWRRSRVDKPRSPMQQESNLVFTIIPTKELVYARKVQEDDLQAPDDYRTLVRMEARTSNRWHQSSRKSHGQSMST